MGLLTELFHQTANRKEYLGQEEVGFWGRWNYLRKRLSITGNGGQFATAKRELATFPLPAPRLAWPYPYGMIAEVLLLTLITWVVASVLVGPAVQLAVV